MGRSKWSVSDFIVLCLDDGLGNAWDVDARVNGALDDLAQKRHIVHGTVENIRVRMCEKARCRDLQPG